MIDPFTIKPLDASTILASARATGGQIITVEDHYKEGGLFSVFMLECPAAGLLNQEPWIFGFSDFQISEFAGFMIESTLSWSPPAVRFSVKFCLETFLELPVPNKTVSSCHLLVIWN